MIEPVMEGFLLAPSILSANFTSLGEAIRQVEAAGADWIHVDVMDGHFVPNLTMGPVVVEACRRATKLPIDVHLMVERPENLLQAFVDAGADSLTVHVEASKQLYRTLQTIHDLGVRAGVVLNPGTPASAITEVLPLVELVLVLSVNPGYAGQAFIESTMAKLRTIRGWRDQQKLRAKIQVDGGINPQTATLAAGAGAEIFVAAHAVFQHPKGIQAGMEALRQALRAAPEPPG